jgi:hypothetical protein
VNSVLKRVRLAVFPAQMPPNDVAMAAFRLAFPKTTAILSTRNN